MVKKHIDEYRAPELAQSLLSRIREESKQPVRLMEVCGTHTMSIMRNGIRNLLPENITLLSGPGCPVCVTAMEEIDAFIAMAGIPDIILTTFGDLMRVPGSYSTLSREKMDGKDIRVVYSPVDALEIAKENPHKTVVFPGVGFETTAPATAATLFHALETGISNFRLYSAHKRVVPALFALTEEKDHCIDGFLLPGHVSVIIGVNGYATFFEKRKIPCAVAGFEPADILAGILALVSQTEKEEPKLENTYQRAVAPLGNPRAGEILEKVYKPKDALWRGLGTIPKSGLAIREEFADMDAAHMDFQVPESRPPRGCICGTILKGRALPGECPLYGKTCTPVHPVGPCMVSSEGVCAAWMKYHGA